MQETSALVGERLADHLDSLKELQVVCDTKVKVRENGENEVQRFYANSIRQDRGSWREGRGSSRRFRFFSHPTQEEESGNGGGGGGGRGGGGEEAVWVESGNVRGLHVAQRGNDRNVTEGNNGSNGERANATGPQPTTTNTTTARTRTRSKGRGHRLMRGGVGSLVRAPEVTWHEIGKSLDNVLFWIFFIITNAITTTILVMFVGL